MGGHHDDRRAAAADVVVWEADGRAGRHGYGHPIARRLRRAGWSVTTVKLTERPPNEAEMTAGMHVLSGGNTAVDSDVAWLVAARERLAWVLDNALAGRCHVTGICFGSQLIAHTLAGRDAVGAHPDGMQAGLFDVVDARGRRGRVGGSIYRSAGKPVVSSFHFHRIRADELERAGGTVELTSERTDVQAFTFGERVAGMQFHPELSPRSLRTTLRTYRDTLLRYGADPASSERSIREHQQRWNDHQWRRFVLRPAARELVA